MPANGKFARKERAPRAGYRKSFDHLRAGLTGTDLGIGLAAAILISALLLGYRFQFIPDMVLIGTRIMTYFCQKAMDTLDSKRAEIAEAEFRYPGPKPQCKEAAILMMADSVEAASRTLKEPSAAQIRGMIDGIVEAIVEDDQFDDCDITMKEIRLAKESFLKILTGVYHRRIDYPGYDFKLVGSKEQKIGTPGPSPKPAKAV